MSGVLVGAVGRPVAEVVKGAERRSGPLTTGGGGRDCPYGDGAGGDVSAEPPALAVVGWHDESRNAGGPPSADKLR